MLDAFCKLIKGLSSVDDGVESILSHQAFIGLMALTESVYGEHAANVLRHQFQRGEDGSARLVVEEAEEAFRLALTGKG